MVVALLAAACGSDDSSADESTDTADEAPAEPVAVTIQIDGAAVPYYSPLYVAAEQGFFEEAGLEVEFTYAPGAQILQNVAAGNVDFGFPNGDSVIAAYANGVETNIVHTTYQEGIGALLFDNSTGIESPADLVGKSVAVTDLGSPNYVQLQAMMSEEDLSIDDVNVQTIGTGAIVQALQNGEVDTIVFSRLRYFALQAAGFDVGQILSDEYLPSFGNVLVTSPSNIEENPEVVSGFIEALDKGIEYVIANPADSVAMAIADYAPEFQGQEAAVTGVIEDLFIPNLWQSDATEENGLGYGDMERWQSPSIEPRSTTG